MERETSNNPLRLVCGLLTGFAFATCAHYMMGVFDVMYLFSAMVGSLGYFLVVGGNFHPLFYFILVAPYMFFGVPVVMAKLGWDGEDSRCARAGGVEFRGRSRNKYD